MTTDTDTFQEQANLGSFVDIGEFCHLRARGALTIGDKVLIASHVSIATQRHPLEGERWGKKGSAPIVIGSEVWIGSYAVSLPGVSIGDGAVAAAACTRKVPPHSLMGGVPKMLDQSQP